MIKKISRASIAFLCTGFILIMSACSSFEKQPSYELRTQYNYSINRDFWGVPYIKGETDQDVAYGIGLVHAEDAYDDLVELMPLYRGENALRNGLKNIDTDYLIRLLKVHSKVDQLAKKQLSSNVLAMAQAYADGVNEYAKSNPDKVNLSLHPISQEDVLAGSYIQHLFFAGLDNCGISLFKPSDDIIIAATISNAATIP